MPIYGQKIWLGSCSREKGVSNVFRLVCTRTPNLEKVCVNDRGLAAAVKKKACITAGLPRSETRIIQQLKDSQLSFYRFGQAVAQS